MDFQHAVKALLQLFARNMARCFDMLQNPRTTELSPDHFDVQETYQPMDWLVTASSTVVTRYLAFVPRVLRNLTTYLPIRGYELAMLRLDWPRQLFDSLDIDTVYRSLGRVNMLAALESTSVSSACMPDMKNQ